MYECGTFRVFRQEPKWYLGVHTMCNTSILEILNAFYDQMGNSQSHVNARRTCRHSLHGLAGIGR